MGAAISTNRNGQISTIISLGEMPVKPLSTNSSTP
jgi:hypothetical protein